ncbi:hypothetical protein ACFVYE_44965 [Streptomyces sp. NPDC058239]|uniref:hypothetical protein n=1 Tax=unclassified Streptomyces TaxID=2593676 RepID=UPI00364A8F2A
MEQVWIAARDLLDPEEADEEADDEAVVAGSLGLPAAGEKQMAALEQRVGLVPPPVRMPEGAAPAAPGRRGPGWTRP